MRKVQTWVTPENRALKLIRSVCCLIILFLAACTQNYAPVDTALPISSEPKRKYIVQKGETLYAIAWRYNLDYRTLAEVNHLSPPYSLEVGQVLIIKDLPPKPKPIIAAKPVLNIPVTQEKQAVSKAVTSKTTPPSLPAVEKIHWIWPAKGRVVAHYSPSVGQKGIDIAGKVGEPVYAAASGKVAYCGSGLRGYGNLIILKHNDEFLSAYAHNQKLLVHEGQEVKGGEIIATMGDTESKTVILHFEIREAGKSVNPLLYVKP